MNHDDHLVPDDHHHTGARRDAALFPPLGNAGLATFAIAEVGADPVVELLRTTLLETRGSEVPSYPHDTDRWLSAAVRRANDQRFRFELRHLHDETGPRVLDLSDPSLAAQLHTPAVTHGRATAKLVVALTLDGPGRATLSAAGIDTAATVQRSALVVWPAFLSVDVVVDGGPLQTLLTTVQGPAFR